MPNILPVNILHDEKKKTAQLGCYACDGTSFFRLTLGQPGQMSHDCREFPASKALGKENCFVGTSCWIN